MTSLLKYGQLRSVVPIIWRAAFVEYAAKHGIGVRRRAVRPQRILVVDPGEDEDLRLGAEAKKDAKTLTANLCR